MTDLYPEIQPYAHGLLDVGDGNRIYWETCGSPDGKPAVVVHGGPGSGCTPRQRRLFDPNAYKIVLFDQRNCGRSTPHASDSATDLASNTTAHLIADMECLREHLGIERWLAFGGSWGSTLALAYAEAYPEHVTEMILYGVTTGRHKEFDWLFRGGVAVLFPEQWERLRASAPEANSDRDVVEVYSQMLSDTDPTIRQRAAEAWCLWESVTPDWPPSTTLDERFRNPTFALAFARIVTHYVRHNAWLVDESLLRGASVLAGIPGILINGRYDLQAPLANAWELRRVWPRAELRVVDKAGHSAGNPDITQEIIQATNLFAEAGQ